MDHKLTKQSRHSFLDDYKEARKDPGLKKALFILGALAIVLIAVVTAMFIVITNSQNAKIRETAENYADEQMKIVVDNVISKIEYLRGTGLSDDAVKKAIADDIHQTVYGKNEYIWVNEVVNYNGGDNYAIRRIHTNLIDTEGDYLSTNTQDAAGNYPYRSELEGINKNGEIYQSYYFKNLADNQISLKYSYAKLYKPYNWIIATGIPLTDLYNLASISQEQNTTFLWMMITAAAVIIFLAMTTAWFLILHSIREAERIRQNTELMRIQKMYEAAVQETKLTVWEFDIQKHRIIMAENEFTKQDENKFGLSGITENVPASLLPYIDDASADAFLEIHSRIEAGVPQASCEIWCKQKNGTETRCERISYVTIFDDAGKPVKAYGMGQNITHQKLAQAEYDRLRAQLTSNLDGVAGSFQLNLSKNLYISGYSPYPNVVESLKRDTADEHFAATAQTIINEDIKADVLKNYTCENLTSLFKSGKQQIERIYPVLTAKGGVLWLHSILHMMQNPDTGDVEGITYTKDITEQKRTREIVDRLTSTGCDYLGVIDVAEGIFKMHTSNWGYKFIAAGQTMVYETVKNKLAERYVITDRLQSFLDDCATDTVTASLKEKEQYIVAYDYKDAYTPGDLLKKQILFSWLNDEKKEILCIQQDITEAYRKEQEQIFKMEEAKNEAIAANEAKSAFLSGMSHDLRTPLNGVLGFTAFALKETDPEIKQNYLHKIDTSGRLLLDLINDTLELSRIESGKATLNKEAVMPMDLIPAVTTALRPSAELKGIQYETHFEIDFDTPVWCDKLKIQKIALNLISNAIKYTPAGGKVSISLTAGCQDNLGNCYILTVKDNGIGMSDEFVKKLYEPFSQEKRSESIRELGSGLGLSIVKRYVDLMDGKIEVKTQLHNGTVFQVCIPLSTENKNLIRMNTVNTDLLHIGGKHVLLCEDNIMNTEIAQMLLKERGVIVITAENGKVGVEKFAASETGSIDAILMDIRMPIMDGYEAVKRIRALQRKDAATIPIIAMTADAFEENVRKAKLSGMNDYITKPIDPMILYQTLSKYIGEETMHGNHSPDADTRPSESQQADAGYSESFKF